MSVQVAGTWRPMVVVLFFKEIRILMKILSLWYKCCCSVAQSCPTVCDPMDCSTQGFPCPSSTPRVYSDSYPLNQWCHPTISSSVVPFSSCLQSFPESGSFPMSQLFTSGGQSIGASASVLPMNIQDWFPVGLTGLIFLQSEGIWEGHL